MTLYAISKNTVYTLILGVVLFLAQPAFAAPTLRVASNFPTEHTASKALEHFANTVEENSDLTVKTFPNMMLGGASQNVDQVRSGVIFGAVLSISYLTRVVPAFQAVTLPFLFNSREDAYQLIDGNLSDILDKRMAKKEFKVLGYGGFGFRNVTNNVHPVEKLSDFQGLKIRLQPNQVQLDTFRALGANPVAMDISEVYSSLQQGVLDGQENPYSIIATRNFNEVQKYLSNTRHFFSYLIFIANKSKFNSLSPASQKVVLKAAHAAMHWQRKANSKKSDFWRKRLIERGMVYTPIPEETREAMREAVEPVVENVVQTLDPEIKNIIQAELQ